MAASRWGAAGTFTSLAMPALSYELKRRRASRLVGASCSMSNKAFTMIEASTSQSRGRLV